MGDQLRLACPYSVKYGGRNDRGTAAIRSFLHSRRPGDGSAVPAAVLFLISISSGFSAVALVVSSEWSKACNPATGPTRRWHSGRAVSTPPRDAQDEAHKVSRWRRRGRHDERRVAMSGRYPGRIKAAFQNATAGAGRAARSAQCQNPNPIGARSVASAIGHGSSAWGTIGFRSSGVRRLPPRARSPIRTGRESAGRPFNYPPGSRRKSPSDGWYGSEHAARLSRTRFFPKATRVRAKAARAGG